MEPSSGSKLLHNISVINMLLYVGACMPLGGVQDITILIIKCLHSLKTTLALSKVTLS